jgi:hypothetical protein
LCAVACCSLRSCPLRGASSCRRTCMHACMHGWCGSAARRRPLGAASARRKPVCWSDADAEDRLMRRRCAQPRRAPSARTRSSASGKSRKSHVIDSETGAASPVREAAGVLVRVLRRASRVRSHCVMVLLGVTAADASWPTNLPLSAKDEAARCGEVTRTSASTRVCPHGWHAHE